MRSRLGRILALPVLQSHGVANWAGGSSGRLFGLKVFSANDRSEDANPLTSATRSDERHAVQCEPHAVFFACDRTTHPAAAAPSALRHKIQVGCAAPRWSAIAHFGGRIVSRRRLIFIDVTQFFAGTVPPHIRSDRSDMLLSLVTFGLPGIGSANA